MRGSEKAISVNLPNNFSVAIGKLDGWKIGHTIEAGKTVGLHLYSLPVGRFVLKAPEFALCGNKVRKQRARSGATQNYFPCLGADAATAQIRGLQSIVRKPSRA